MCETHSLLCVPASFPVLSYKKQTKKTNKDSFLLFNNLDCTCLNIAIAKVFKETFVQFLWYLPFLHLSIESEVPRLSCDCHSQRWGLQLSSCDCIRPFYGFIPFVNSPKDTDQGGSHLKLLTAAKAERQMDSFEPSPRKQEKRIL